jgi:hypothetical protein
MQETIKIATDQDFRCQASTASGQCKFAAAFDGGNCALHKGNAQAKSLCANALYVRLNDRYRQRLEAMKSSKGHFTLNEEVGILRLLLEDLLTSVENNPNKMLRSIGQASDLISRIERLVTSAMKAEKYVGELLSRNQAAAMLQDAVNIIAEEIQDIDVLTRIADRLNELATKTYEDETK